MFRAIVLAILFVYYGIPLIILLLSWLFGTTEGLVTLGIIVFIIIVVGISA